MRLMPRTSVGAPIDSDRNAGVMDDRLAEYVFHVLYRAADVEAAIPLILEIVGRQFDVCRAYLFEISEDGCSSQHLRVVPRGGRENSAKWPARRSLAGFFPPARHAPRDGRLLRRDISPLPGPVRELMERRGCAASSAPSTTARELHGGLGFDECRSNRLWTQKQVDTPPSSPRS
ncbi:MAG: hypothetical protein ACLVL7_09665 [Anaerotruncus massiliensis (ex Togo et al. 2019)]